MKVACIRKAHFNAAHRLFNKSWSDEKNREVFGLCSNPHFHGHNYNLEVKVIGEVEPDTGFVIDMKILKDLIEEHVCSYLDHKNLNIEIKEFENLIPTAENIAIVIYNILRVKLPEKFDIFVKLFETERNWVEYPV